MTSKTPIEQFKNVYNGNLIDTLFNNAPCIIVSLFTATFSFTKSYPVLGLDKNFNGDNYPCDKKGYCSLKEANRVIRLLFDVNKYTYYKLNERKKLKDLELKGVNIICCKGHYLSTNNDEYYSFFNNDDDEVVSIWELNSFLIKKEIKEWFEND